MKSTELDRTILRLLREREEGIPLYQMARMLNKNPSNLYRRLQKLIIHNFVTKIRGRIAIYKLGTDNQPKVYFKVICPKCYTISIADYYQLTKVCPNSDCTTKKGKRTRYVIDVKRIIDKVVM